MHNIQDSEPYKNWWIHVTKSAGSGGTGGAAYATTSGSFMFAKCIFTSNTAKYGGVIGMHGGSGAKVLHRSILRPDHHLVIHLHSHEDPSIQI